MGGGTRAQSSGVIWGTSGFPPQADILGCSSLRREFISGGEENFRGRRGNPNPGMPGPPGAPSLLGNGFRGGFNRSLGRTAWRHCGANTRPLHRSDLDEFVSCYHPANRHERKAPWSEANRQGRWRPYGYDQLSQRDKLSLDIFWLKDDSLEDSANLEDPDVIAAEIIDDLCAALEEFELMLGDSRT
jgi:hypothetical protein